MQSAGLVCRRSWPGSHTWARARRSVENPILNPKVTALIKCSPSVSPLSSPRMRADVRGLIPCTVHRSGKDPGPLGTGSLRAEQGLAGSWEGLQCWAGMS